MTKRIIPFVIIWIVAVAFARGNAQVAGAAGASPGLPVAGSPAAAADPQTAFVNQYCVTCHNQRLKTGGLALDTKDLGHVGPDADTWEKVVRKVKTGMMPPAGARRPERTLLDGFAADL